MVIFIVTVNIPLIGCSEQRSELQHGSEQRSEVQRGSEHRSEVHSNEIFTEAIYLKLMDYI